MEDQIIDSLYSTKANFAGHLRYPKKPGLYALMLGTNSKLREFGREKQVIYVGKAERSLASRDLKTHFVDRKTGSSTLRRSIGSILKSDFNFIAFTRNGTLSRVAIDNYKFDTASEEKLTFWMKENLEIGYWEYDSKVAKGKELIDLEEELTIILKPTLDLAKRTRKYNVYADKLTELRQICKDEATHNATNNIRWY